MNSILKTIAANHWLKLGLIVSGFASVGLYVWIGWWWILVTFLCMCLVVVLALINIDGIAMIEMGVMASKGARRMKKEAKNDK